MPYKRRRYGSSKRLSRPAYYYAKYLDMAYKQGEAQKRLNTMVEYAKDVTSAGSAYMYNPSTGGYAKQTQATILEGLAARGKGAYGFGKIGRGIGGAIGGALGSRAAGAAIGGFLGRTGSDLMLGGGGYVAGSGAYGGATNSLISGSSVAVPTMMGGDEIGSIVVTHKEYLGNITGSIQFENSSFELNPGLPQTFPWLSQIAQNYEEYSFEQLMFTYTSLLSDSTAAGVIGSIIMTTNYNAGQPDFQNSADMLNNIGTVSARPIDGPIIHGIECDDSKNVQSSYYVRSGKVPTGQDIKTYDIGRYQVATEGMPEDSQLQGQLWVSYCIVLRKPKIFTAVGKGIKMDQFKTLTTSGFSLNFPVGKVLLAAPYNNIGTTVTIDQALPMRFRVNFPETTVQGLFRLEWTWINPTDNSGYPNQPKMSAVVTGSNIVSASQEVNAWFGSENTGFIDNCAFQNGTYDTGIGFSFDSKIVQNFIFRLGGSFAIPTYVEVYYPNFTGTTFNASDFQLNIFQINPMFQANVPENPSGWIPVSTLA